MLPRMDGPPERMTGIVLPFHREKIVNRAVPQPISIGFYNTFSSESTEVKALYFTVDSLSFHTYICCVLQKAIEKAYKSLNIKPQ